MSIPFSKLHGLGNDFILIDGLDGSVTLDSDTVAHMCDRRFGIGADGVIVALQPRSPEGCAFMCYFNADGSRANMCGNGIRCLAKFLVDEGKVASQSESLVIDTLAGPKRIVYRVDDLGKLETATVDMGIPAFAPADVPTLLAANAQTDSGSPLVREAEIPSPWGSLRFTCVSMGNPHAVCFIDAWDELPQNAFAAPESERTLETLDVRILGAYFEKHALFPEKTNVEFAEVKNGRIHMRVYERGCEETLACGTGACATAVAAHLTNRLGRSADIALIGGELHVEWSATDHVLLTGPARISYTGSVDLRDLVS